MRKKVLENQAEFVQVVQTDPEFVKFVEDVSPRLDGVQQVWIAELFLVLKILWEIYQILKGLGFFKKWFETRKVKKAMRLEKVALKETALMHVRDSLTVPV